MIFLIMFFVIEFFLAIASYDLKKSDWIFINHSLFYPEKYSLQLDSLQF